MAIRKPEDIAIVGMACLFPGAPDLATFWQNIVEGHSAISDPPADWLPASSTANKPFASEPIYVQKGGYLGDLSRFNAINYGVLPASVDGAEPDQYLALRCAYEALADAGIPERPLNRERTGVYLGRGIYFNRGTLSWIQHGLVVDQLLGVIRQLEPELSEHRLLAIRDELKKSLPNFSAESVPGLVPCLLTGRIANRLDLKGPTYTLDAACASSLVAVEHAMKDLRSGECDAVLAGGVQVTTSVLIHQLFCKINGLSKRGVAAPLSTEADGTLLGEGCGIVLLKRRSDAEREGHRIYALLKGVGVASDGKGAGLLAPRTEGQQLAIRRIYQQLDIAPHSIELLEAHATGLPVGDKVELESVAACFRNEESVRDSIAVGSVKSMIGHLLPASGAASLIKTALALYHRTLPPSLNAEKPATELREAPFYLNRFARPWIRGGLSTPRRAGINAFGFGGINAHAVLEEYPETNLAQQQNYVRAWPSELVVVSGGDKHDLLTRALSLADWTESSDEEITLVEIAAASAKQKGACCLALIAKTKSDLVNRLRHMAKLLKEEGREKIQDRSGAFWFGEPLGKSGRVAFLFPGEGAQYVDMLKELCFAFPEVRREFDLTDAAFREVGNGRPLSRAIYPVASGEHQVTSPASDMHTNDLGLSMTTAAERALVALLRKLEIAPDCIVGHSNGEFAALQAAGAFANSEDDAGLIRLIRLAAEATRNWGEPGLVPAVSMLSVGGTPANVLEQALASTAGRVNVVIDNCPSQIVLAGDDEAISSVERQLKGKGGLCEKLPWSQPFHTPEFGPACGILKRFVKEAGLGVPRIETWSCMTAAPHPADAERVQALAVEQLAGKLRFRETIEAMYVSGVRVFIEAGPRGMLSSFVADTLGKLPHAIAPLDLPHRRSLEQLCFALALLSAHQVDMNLSVLYESRYTRSVDLNSAHPPKKQRVPTLSQALPELTLNEECLKHIDRPARVARVPVGPMAQETTAAEKVTNAPPIGEGISQPRERSVMVPTKPQIASAPQVSNAASRPAAIAHRVPMVASHSVAERATSNQTRSTAMQAFQNTMQQFLHTQEQVTLIAQKAAQQRRQPVTATSAQALSAASRSPSPVVQRGSQLPPLIDRVFDYAPGLSITTESELSLDRCGFLADHAFFGRRLSIRNSNHCGLPVMPLAGSLEIMAEGASLLRPNLVVSAIANIKTSRWLVFETPVRRLRVTARIVEGTDFVETHLFDLDEDPLGSATIASCTFEFTAPQEHLGVPSVVDVARTNFSYGDDEIYRFLFHGDAFQGIRHMEAVDREGTRCVIQEPDERLLFPHQIACGALPVALLDLCGQIAGMVLRDVATDDVVTLSFPNSVERVEFARNEARKRPMIAVSRVRMTEKQLGSDVEMINSSGEVVLRAMNRVEELARLPADLYSYRHSPTEMHMTRDLNSLFAGIPELTGCSIRFTGNIGHKALVNRVWFQTLAWQVLTANEREHLSALKLQPVPAINWLLGRVAAKDAVRNGLTDKACMADVEIHSLPSGEPTVRLLASRVHPPIVSIAHKPFFAVSAAGSTLHYAGIGIDIENSGSWPMDATQDAFGDSEIGLIASAAAQMHVDISQILTSAWCAKEAAGKAISTGIVSSPKGLQITGFDPVRGCFEIQPQKAFLSALQQKLPNGGHPTLRVWIRNLESRTFAVCVIPRGLPVREMK